jgi:hypothetical protein
MASRFIWQIGRVRSKSSWVSREVSRFSHARDVVVSDTRAEQGRHSGRRARSDQVAACLLRRGMPANEPVRQRDQITRNRRRLVVLSLLMVAWWVCGRAMG